MLFTQIVRQRLLESGIDRKLLEDVLKSSVKQFRSQQTYDRDCANVLSEIHQYSNGKEHRGIDSIGRLLVEYCFIRIPETKLIWPENSEQDTQSRIGFSEGIIPRPLLRYFLVSVRGTIPELNKFDAPSVLFGEENTVHEERKDFVNSLIKEFNSSDKQNSGIKWNEVYSDSRFQKVALELIGDIRRKIDQFGHERFLRILENLRQRDPEKNGVNAMQRTFIIDDVEQIDESLWAAEEALSQKLG